MAGKVTAAKFNFHVGYYTELVTKKQDGATVLREHGLRAQ